MIIESAVKTIYGKDLELMIDHSEEYYGAKFISYFCLVSFLLFIELLILQEVNLPMQQCDTYISFC